MAKSYYKKIQGVRYDRALMESAEERIKGQGDGRISDQDINEIIDLSKDGNKVTLTELRTIKYIKDHDLQWQPNRKIIKPDNSLKSLLNMKKNEELTYFNIQKYMKNLFYPMISVKYLSFYVEI